ncbi:hypothetical protein [Halostella salina]|uniref:hypothetical protein n=1 Tax=Halostella salina TaxID=1547897 RepID=UPI0013CE5497|nr:hypothetical protein [Halostella salina]
MRLVERLRRIVGDSTDGSDSQPYQCLNCGESFQLQRQRCPTCGGYRIERAAWSETAE